jgi:hypothetical protein
MSSFNCFNRTVALLLGEGVCADAGKPWESEVAAGDRSACDFVASAQEMLIPGEPVRELFDAFSAPLEPGCEPGERLMFMPKQDETLVRSLHGLCA